MDRKFSPIRKTIILADAILRYLDWRKHQREMKEKQRIKAINTARLRRLRNNSEISLSD